MRARFNAQGYSVRVTGLSGDHGIDLVVERMGGVAVIKCKNHGTGSEGEPALCDLCGAMLDSKATKAFLVTTGN